jgi:riboflavin kinase/FMN adenylyltransferase
MKLFYYTNGQLFTSSHEPAAPFLPRTSAITLGTFDGVHLGHRKIISALTSKAHAAHLQSVLITFEPHPRTVVAKKDAQPVQLLTTTDEKIALLSALHLDAVVIINFTKAFSELSPETFVEKILLKEFGLAAMVIGYDHGFGKDRSGTLQTLQALSVKHSFSVDVVEELVVEQRAVSSTLIRSLLSAGRISEANRLLGSPYRLMGKVIYGDQRGRLIGFPTANLALPDPLKLVPCPGVYVADALLGTTRLRAMVNIGYRPTVSDASQLSIEAHILNFTGDLYGQVITLELLSRLRDEQKFTSLAALKAQLERDKQSAAAFSTPSPALQHT